ncbi:MAG TPA: hypothetical protein VMI56_18290 [Reyranella sp.]|nr:hypothetical protein [Reyranella sp.]
MSARICLVTGVDHGMFDQLLLLGGSLRRYSPSLKLHVLDFGLTEPQRRFVAERYGLLDRPADMAARRHPWYYKAAMGRYLANTPCDAAVWIDADMIALSDLAPPLLQLYAEMETRNEAIAVADSGMTIAQQLAHDPAAHYASLVKSLDTSAPYVNSGLFLCRSSEFLDRWSAQTEAMAFEMLFEQNAFNLVALAHRHQVKVIDRFRWNLVANELDRAQLSIAGHEISATGPAGQVLILHATSTNRARDLSHIDFPLRANGQPFSIKVRMISWIPELLAFQKELTLETIRQDGELLMKCGAWPPAATAASTAS